MYSTKNTLPARNVFRSSANKVYWKCEEGCEDFLAIPANVIGVGSGCPACKFKTERKVGRWLLSHYPDTVQQFTFTGLMHNKRSLPFDFVVPSLKTILEVDGDQHFKQVSNWKDHEETRERDILKMKYAESQGYKVIRIYQMDIYRNNEEWMDETLLPRLQDSDRAPVFLSSKNELYDGHKVMYEADNEICLNTVDYGETRSPPCEN